MREKLYPTRQPDQEPAIWRDRIPEFLRNYIFPKAELATQPLTSDQELVKKVNHQNQNQKDDQKSKKEEEEL